MKLKLFLAFLLNVIIFAQTDAGFNYPKKGCLQEFYQNIYCYNVSIDQFRNFMNNRLLDGYNSISLSSCNFGELPLNWIPDNVAENITYMEFQNVNMGKIHPKAFESFTNLGIFKIKSSQIVTLPTGVFSYMEELTYLLITGTNIANLEPEVFANIPKVQAIQIGLSPITTWQAGMFQNLTSLLSVGAEKCGLTSVSVDSFINTPNVMSVDIASNSLPSFSTPVFNNLPALSALYLGDNNIKSISSDIFSKMKSVDGIYLAINHLTDLPILENVDQVTRIFLYRNKLTNLDWLTPFGNVQDINLKFNKITNFDVGIFNSTPSLSGIGLAFNRLTDLNILKLADILPYISIDLGGNPWDCNNLRRILNDAQQTEIKINWGTLHYNVSNVNGIPCINNSL